MSSRKTRRRRTPIVDPVEAARAADLRYVSDADPGIRRLKSGRGFTYRGADGRTIRDRSTLARIGALAIPPAWTDVWIGSTPNGHIQATGRDARGRKQYRYHARWRQFRDETKYERMALFGENLPLIRRRVTADLQLPGLPKPKLLAMIVRLLEKTLIRVGNEEYARSNGSFGLTTLRNHHVEVDGSAIRFRFKGKGGIAHDLNLTDRRLARLVRKVRDLPGQGLFQYLDENSEAQPVGSEDVNQYLREITGSEFTAKDFRTWAGTLIAAESIGLSETPEGDPAKGRVRDAVATAARRLGNTVAICRKCYIHPKVLEAVSDAALGAHWREARGTGPVDGLAPEESALLAFLSRLPPAGG
jgi:DNA topoisomerase I